VNDLTSSLTKACAVFAVVLFGALPIAGGAQVVPDSTRPRTDPSARTQAQTDSLRPPLSPGRAFLTSLILPGLGQSRLNRAVPGAIYAGFEAFAITMLLKARNDLRIAEALAADVIVNGYRVDPVTGAPVLDEDGQFVPLDTVPNRFDQERVESRKTLVEDWIAVLVFNHLFAGADAFVASLLWDLPARVGMRKLQRGIGLGLSVRW
jgi:hypothetical protein